jgi:long-subunit fatty acid transport protein
MKLHDAHKPLAFFYFIILLFAAMLFWSSWLKADENHYNNILIGDRAAGMGGAYVAVSDDPSGLYYNPAGIVYAIGSNISGSMNALHQTSTTYKDALGGTYDWKRTSSVLFPNYFGVFQSLGKGKIGFSYAVPDSILEDQDQTFKNIPGTSPSVSTFVINFNNQDTTYNVGPSYAVEINDNLSAGITLYGHIRTQERINNQLTYLLSDTDYEWKNQYFHTEEKGLRPVFGLMWTPHDKISAGVTVSKTYIFSSSTDVQTTCQGASTVAYGSGSLCVSGDINRIESKSDKKKEYPLQMHTGVAYFPNERLLLSGDLIYNGATDASLVSARESVLNFAVGAEYYLNSQWAVRSGLYSNYANTPELRTTGVSGIQPEHVDMYGLSVSISHFLRSSSLSFGFTFMNGNGKAQLFSPDSSGNTSLQDVNIFTLTSFLSVSSSF